MRPDEVRDRLAVAVPDDHSYETVAGFIVSRLGRLAQMGDEVRLDEGRLRVDRLTGRRIERIRFIPEPPHEEATLNRAAAQGGAQ
jgi:CBS domain containing-hemolysin-like protein